jgi:hypothetical protein
MKFFSRLPEKARLRGSPKLLLQRRALIIFGAKMAREKKWQEKKMATGDLADKSSRVRRSS